MLVIGIAGGTGSGKSTVVRRIVEQLEARGKQVTVVPQDSYYKDSSHLPLEERLELNFDHPKAIDWPLMTEQIADLKAGRAIDQPLYSYLTCSRSATETLRVEPTQVIIVEGILILTSQALRDIMDIKVFVDADADVRLCRVIQRDIVERGRTVEKVLERYHDLLKPMHQQFIEPSKAYADIIVPQGGHNVVAIDILLTIIEKALANK